MNTNTSPKRFMLVGCGGIAQHAHLPAFEKYPDQLRLAALCDPNPSATSTVVERMEKIATPKVFHDYREAYEMMAGEIDAVLIATPHFLHYPQLKAALLAGIPALVEKPLCNTLEEADELLALSREKELLVVVGQNKRFTPQAQWLHQWVASHPDHLGELCSFNLHGWQNIEAWIASKPDKNADFWILDKDRAGGGVVISLMVHGIDLIRYITGLDYIEVAAKGRFDPPFKHGAESTCSALITMSNGAVGTMHSNYLTRRCPRPLEELKVVGTYGTIQINDTTARYGSSMGTEITAEDWRDDKMQEVPIDHSLILDERDSIAQLLSFARALDSDQKPLNDIEQNYNSIAAVHAMMISMNNGGKPVEVKHA